jgi:signal recognition particle receptor subunit alpha
VGEALVGNEAVDQLSKFDRSLKDFSTVAGGPGKGRGIDGMLVTKWDTVDDKVTQQHMLYFVLTRLHKVGAALSMTYVTGQPILFVGCGQASNQDNNCPSYSCLALDVHRLETVEG